MITLLVGTDLSKRSLRLEKLIKGYETIRLSKSEISYQALDSHALNQSLFEAKKAIILENILSKADISFDKTILTHLSDSETLFIFLEDKLLAADEKKYAKYGTVEKFTEIKKAASQKFNTFSIADAFGRRDKIGTWVLYCQAIEHGIEPEAISGILFWKIKTMIIGGGNGFSIDELKENSGKLVALYHRSHRGESDFVVGLEQFILDSLSPKVVY